MKPIKPILNAFIQASLVVSLVILFQSCEKTTEQIIPGNDSVSSTGISAIKIENYVNRLFIDLIGREPTDEEQIFEAEQLNADDLSKEARLGLISKLMTDTSFSVNEGSYHQAYNQNLYILAKIRCLEGVTDQIIRSDFLSIFKANALRDSLNANWDAYHRQISEIRRCEYLLRTSEQLRTGVLKYHEIFAFLIDNPVYDELNMNSFNFIRASFDQLLFRLPTEEEYSQAFKMVEHKQLDVFLGKSGNSKEDYVDILINSEGMKEGMIRWAFITFLVRDPSPAEIATLLDGYQVHEDINQVISQILVTDEYANFF